MVDKFEIYDLVSIIVPGALIVTAVPLAFPGIAAYAGHVHFPDAFAVIVLTALSIFAGHLVQSLASLIEPILNKTWGGRASEVALTKGLGDRFLPLDAAVGIRAKLVAATSPDASKRTLFLHAMNLAESSGSSRVRTFNALYAYHRALVVLTLTAIILFIASFRGGFAASLPWKQAIVVSCILVALLVLFWNRTRERGFYYVREVLFCAARQLPSPTM